MKTKRQEGAHAGELEFTGERYLPEVGGQIAFEHLHRYHFAARHAVGKAVLDVACGEGYGTNILAAAARAATGLDISVEAVIHARAGYSRANLDFVAGSAAQLPFPDGAFDLVVSFETIEHHDRHQEMISEIHRVLRPGGLLIISSPNKQYYSVEPGYHNPYHVKELFREEFLDLLGSSFQNVQLQGQRVVYGSILVPMESASFQSLRHAGNGDDVQASEGLAKPHYDLALASDAPLPSPLASIFEMSVHGLDPAAFYGVHLPERIAIADAELIRLRTEGSSRQADRDHAQAEFQGRIDALRSIHDQLADELRSTRDARTQALQDLVSEKEVRLQAAAESKRQLESWLAELQLHSNNLEARRAELESELSASMAHASGLTTQLVEYDGRIADAQTRLDQSLAHAETLILDRALAQARSQSLAADLVERDQRLQALATDLAESDARLQVMAADLAKREARLQALAADLAERDGWLQGKSDQIADSETRLQRVTELLLQAQQHGLEHIARAEGLEEQIRRVTASRSWRYTAMFRRTPK